MFRVLVECHPDGRYAVYSRETGELWARTYDVVKAASLVRGEQVRALAKKAKREQRA